MTLNIETIINVIFAIIFGLAFGSYATMAQYRLPNNRPWSSINLMEGDKIHCPGCKTQLHFKYWCPIIGFIRTFGKCIYCGMRVNRLYLVTEVGITTLSVANVLLYSFYSYYIPMQIFGSCMVVLAVIEIEYRKVPQPILMTMLLAAIMIRMMTMHDINMLVMEGMLAVAIGAILRVISAKLTGKNEFLVDYVKLFGLSGILFPWPALVVFSIIATVMIVITYIVSRLRKTSPPYALPLIAAYFIVLYGYALPAGGL